MIETARLLLRWPEARDFAAHAAMLGDAEAMALFGQVHDEAASRAALARHASYRSAGLGFWSTIERESGACIGFCGLKPGAPGTPIESEIEIGWLIARAHWGRGFASEAAAASLDAAWARPGVTRVVAIISRRNEPSHRVARTLGMTHRPVLDFIHPGFPRGDPLAAMCTYVIERAA